MNAPARIIASPERARLTVDDYLLLNDSGAFENYTKTELIEGEIWVMNAQYSLHARAKSRLLVELSLALRDLGDDLEAVSEVAVHLSDDTMPEPDIVLTRWRGRGAVPVETVALVVEVAETTIKTDLGRKADLYAAAGVPEYWVVDLNENRVLMHEHPEAHGYAGCLDVPFGDPLTSATIEGLSVPSDRLVD